MDSTLLTLVGINILMAWSFYVIYMSGQVSLGNAGFMAIGAYASSVATVKFQVPFFGGLLVAIIVGAAFGWLVGLPALRIRGVYLGMATIGFASLVQSFFNNFEYTGTQVGFRGMMGTTEPILYGIIAVLLVCLVRLQRSRLGKALHAVRENETVASTLGLDVVYLKLLAFIIGASIASLAGALYAHFIFFISPEQFTFWQSAWPAFYVVIGGANTVVGPLLGAVVVTLLPEYFRALKEWRLLVFASVVMVLIAVRPDGLWSRAVERSVARLWSRTIGKRVNRSLRVEARHTSA
ncbi:MAG TPA: branched-chain amino acid ABC transporter permease [Chloroflexota bacterium]